MGEYRKGLMTAVLLGWGSGLLAGCERTEKAAPPEAEAEWFEQTPVFRPSASTPDPGSSTKELGSLLTRLGMLSVFQTREEGDSFDFPSADGVFWLRVGDRQWAMTELSDDYIELKAVAETPDGGVNALIFGCSGMGCNYTAVISVYVNRTGKQLSYSELKRVYRYPESVTQNGSGEITVLYGNWEDGKKRRYSVDKGQISSELEDALVDEDDVSYCEYLYEALGECTSASPQCEIDTSDMQTLSAFSMVTIRYMGGKGDAPYLDKSAYMNACLETCQTDTLPLEEAFFDRICSAGKEMRAHSLAK